MANEITVRSSLSINNGALQVQSKPSSFVADQTNIGGPTPGEVLISLIGTDIDLTQLSSPGLVHITNLDTTNWVEYGSWDPSSSRFVPIGELLPGECYVFRLSRYLGEEFSSPGTGMVASNGRLRFRAHGAAVKVVINAYEK